MTDEIIEMMDQRRAAKKENEGKYKELNKKIKKKCNKEKENWLNSKCENIEALKNKDARNMCQEIKEITGKKGCVSNGCIKAKDGSMILEKVNILDRWKEYIEDLFEDDRGEKPVIRKVLEGGGEVCHSKNEKMVKLLDQIILLGVG